MKIHIFFLHTILLFILYEFLLFLIQQYIQFIQPGQLGLKFFFIGEWLFGRLFGRFNVFLYLFARGDFYRDLSGYVFQHRAERGKVLLRVQFDPVALFALQIPRKSNDLRVVAHTDVKPAIPADLLLACTGCGRLTGFQERGVGIGAFGIGHSLDNGGEHLVPLIVFAQAALKQCGVLPQGVQFLADAPDCCRIPDRDKVLQFIDLRIVGAAQRAEPRHFVVQVHFFLDERVSRTERLDFSVSKRCPVHRPHRTGSSRCSPSW